MNIQPDPAFRKELLEKIAKREFKERTGVHVSDLIYCLNKQALRRRFPQPPTANELLLFSLGWSTQRWLTGKDEDEPEAEQDGIIVTLDARAFLNQPIKVNLPTGVDSLDAWDAIPWELKASYQSSARPVEENIAWIRQIMAQCYVTGTKTAFLSRLEIMGNWKSVYGKKVKDQSGNILYDEKDLEENRKPTLSAWRLEFTEDELMVNWEWLQVRRDMFQKLLDGGELLPKGESIPPSQDYECERCAYKGTLCNVR